MQLDNLQAVRFAVSLSLHFTAKRTAYKLRLKRALCEIRTHMNKSLEKYKIRYLSTEYPRWRNIGASLFLLLVSCGCVFVFWHTYFTEENYHCHNGFFFGSVIWLATQLVVIAYLFHGKTIQKYAREAIFVLIAMGNVWFILFIVGLNACST